MFGHQHAPRRRKMSVFVLKMGLEVRLFPTITGAFLVMGFLRFVA